MSTTDTGITNHDFEPNPLAQERCEICLLPKESIIHKPEKEAVNHPIHYGGDTTYEAIKVIRAWCLGFSLGNAVKYICRAGKKGETLEDLRKARWYLDEEIKHRESLARSA